MSQREQRREVVHFSGRVQGVGFRYTVLQVARGFEVAGFVRNLSDGRVLLEVEGSPGEIDEFIGAIKNQMSGYIREVERREEANPAHHQGFVIR